MLVEGVEDGLAVFRVMPEAVPWAVLGACNAKRLILPPSAEVILVLDGDDAVIPGLYAAGSTGQGGVLLEGHGHHLGWAFTSGRIAGRNAAAERPTGQGSETDV